MIGNSAKQDLPETLFTPGDDDEPKTATRVKRKHPLEEASTEFLELVDDVTKRVERRKGKPRTIAAAQFDRARVEVQEMMDSGNWSGCGARHLVAIYDMMHLKCYGVSPVELGPSERFNAAMMAANLVKREFSGDYNRAVQYMRWAWTREMRTEKWRREQGRDEARRIGTRLMFAGALLTDYRLYLARAEHRK